MQIRQGTAIGAVADAPLGGPSSGRHAQPTRSEELGLSGSVDGKLALGGDLIYVYNFPVEYGGQDAAQTFLDGRRDGVNQAIDIVGGPATSTVREGANRVGDWLGNTIGDRINPPDAAEQAAREQNQRMTTADAASLKVSLQAEGNLRGDAGMLRGGAQLKGSVDGQIDVALTTSGPDQGRNAFIGQVGWDGKVDATLGLPGDPGLPPLLNLNRGAGNTWSYKVFFDGDGNATQLILTEEGRSFDGGGLDAKGKTTTGSGTKLNGGVKAGATSGTMTQHTWTLDLADPASREAFDGFFTVLGTDFDGHAGNVVVPTALADPVSAIRAWAPPQAEITRASIYTDLTYDTYGDQLSASAGRKELKVAKVGVGGEKTSSSNTLVEATMRDPLNGNIEIPLVTCGSN